MCNTEEVSHDEKIYFRMVPLQRNNMTMQLNVGRHIKKDNTKPLCFIKPARRNLIGGIISFDCDIHIYEDWLQSTFIQPTISREKLSHKLD